MDVDESLGGDDSFDRAEPSVAVDDNEVIEQPNLAESHQTEGRSLQ